MSDKKIAYLVEISKLDPIPGKDRIFLAGLKNIDWTVIVGKEDFKIGDLGVFFEVDSILPVRPEFEFLRKRCFSERYNGFRIRTMKLRNPDGTFSYSQGLLMPMSILQSKEKVDDFEKALGVRRVEDEVEDGSRKGRRYPKPVYLFLRFLRKLGIDLIGEKMSSRFPSDLVSRTDETQVQNLSYVYESWKGKGYYSTVKMDGSSMTVVKNGDRFIVASRNLKLYDDKIQRAARKLTPKNCEKYRSSPYLRMVCKLDLPAKMRRSRSVNWMALQGELCGPKIQNNRMGFDDLRFFVFNSYDIKKKKYYNYHWMKMFCNELVLETVPFIEYGTFNFRNIDDLRDYAKGTYENGHPREGVVIRLDLSDNENEPFVLPPERGMSNMSSLKIINEDFREVVES